MRNHLIGDVLEYYEILIWNDIVYRKTLNVETKYTHKQSDYTKSSVRILS